MLKVAIDTGPLTSGDKIRGVGFYTRELIAGLERESKKRKDFTFTKLDTNSIRDKAHEFDILHFPFFKPYVTELPETHTKMVVTIHDVIPLLYPNHYPSGLRGSVRLRKQIRDLKRVSVVITDTEASKKDIVRYLHVPQAKIVPIHLAPAAHFKKVMARDTLNAARKKYSLPTQFALYVGDINYNKNIPTLIKACEIVKLPLVLVGKQAQDIENYELDIQNLQGPRDWMRFLFGKPHPEVAHYKELLTYFRNNKTIYRLGFITDTDLVAIYNLASLYCQPSFYEGFGLPVLEAIACEIPVVASKTQALVEIAEGSVLFADPHNEREFAKKILRLLKDEKLQQSLIKSGYELLKRYSWTKTAQETLAVYTKVASN